MLGKAVSGELPLDQVLSPCKKGFDIQGSKEGISQNFTKAFPFE